MSNVWNSFSILQELKNKCICIKIVLDERASITEDFL